MLALHLLSTDPDIYGDLSVGKIAITDGTDSFKVGTGGSIFNITDGGVGIGTTDPQSSLVVFPTARN